jgi:glycosyltransferase involved in cell wall biosynthesis
MKNLRSAYAALNRRLWFSLNRRKFVDARTPRRPRVLIDVSVIARHDARTGIQRVVRAIWSEFAARKHPVYDFVPVYAGGSHGYYIADAASLARRSSFRSKIASVRAGDKFLGLDLSAHFLPSCEEQLSAWRSAGATLHAVVYDLLPLTRPEWFNKVTRVRFGRWFQTVTEHFDQLLCISDAVASQVRQSVLGRDTQTIGRLHLSGDIAGSVPSTGLDLASQQLLRVLAHTSMVLMVGTVEPRKGYNTAIDALETLWREHGEQAPHLVIVGKAGWKTAEVQDRLRLHPEAGRRLHWLEDVSDEALTRFYELASILLVASRAEGYGLPLSEAAMHRTWVLARDLPVFREQGLPNVRFFNDESPGSLSRRVLDMIDLARNQEPPSKQLPSWSQCVDWLLEELGVDARKANPPPVEAPRAQLGV